MSVEFYNGGRRFYKIKTTFDFKNNSPKAFKQYGYRKTWKQREAVN